MKARFRRKQRLIKPGLQLKIIFMFLSTGVICILVQFALLSQAVSETVRTLPHDGAYLQSVLWKHLLVSLGLLIPLTFAVGAVVTNKLVGPLHRFEMHLRKIAQGENPGNCRIREDDELQELCELINVACDALRSGAGAVAENSETAATMTESAAGTDAQGA